MTRCVYLPKPGGAAAEPRAGGEARNLAAQAMTKQTIPFAIAPFDASDDLDNEEVIAD